MTKISIIIPVINEAESIVNLLSHLLHNSYYENLAEIIVVDGGSNDGSQDIINDYINLNTSKLSTPIKLLNSDKGRAKQMNLGAKNSKGQILYFLHADSFPPKKFDELILKEVSNDNLAGCFKMKFDNSHWWLKLASWLTQFSWRACRGGDQSQFISKELFEKLNGFDERYIIYEDNDLINKLYSRNQFVVIQEWIITSSRRYTSNGIWNLQYHFWTIYVKKWFGASANELHRYYQKNIN